MDFQKVRDACKRANSLFVDPGFRANDASLYYSKKPDYPIVWKRPKDICKEPKLLVDGASRLDIQQGMLGDCWLLAAFGSLLSSPLNLIAKVIPDDQNFEDDYAGIFHFKFWQYGKWTEVIVDDLLPTWQNRLVMTHSAEKNEFWCALLEKAYAKLHGSYEALKGGKASEAMEDLTGGVSEKFYNIANCDQDEMWKTFVKAYKKSSLMGCSIKSTRGEQKAAFGLIAGHAYSITAIETLGNGTRLIRVRNPWGNEAEWTGAWSDHSREWEKHPQDKARLYKNNNDGEFWISMQDFCSNFTSVEICHLGPGGSAETFQEAVYPGVWRVHVSAGGCMNYRDTFHINPQYTFTVEVDDDDTDGKGTVVISLLQKGRRKLQRRGVKNLQIGFAIYKLQEDGSVGKLSKQYFQTNRHIAMSDSFLNSRSVCKTFSFEPGRYVVVPSTFKANEAGDFYCRVFTEKEMENSGELDEEDKHDPDAQLPSASQDEEAEDDEMLNDFNEIAGEEGEIDVYELQDNFLDPNLKKAAKTGTFDGCSLETCRSMLAIADTSLSGRLDHDEFKVVLKSFRKWMRIFKTFDKDGNGYFQAIELRDALRSAGYTLSNRVYSILGTRYAGKDANIAMDDFIQLAFKLEKLFATFNKFARNNGKECRLPLQKFLIATMNS